MAVLPTSGAGVELCLLNSTASRIVVQLPGGGA